MFPLAGGLGSMNGTQVDRFPGSFSGDTGEIGFLFPQEVQDVAELFATPVDVHEGSNISVIEEVFLEMEIEAPTLVDLDKRWFGGRPYLGTYRLYSDDQILTTYVDPESEGFITSDNLYLRRESSYLVVSDRQGIPKSFGKIVLDKCSFELAPFSVAQVPPIGIGLGIGFRPSNPIALMRGQLTSTFFPLGAGRIKRRIASIGLSLRPGVIFGTGRRITRIGGQVETLRPVELRSETCGIPLDDCDGKESDLFAEGTGIYRTYGEAFQAIVDNLGPDDDLAVLASLIASATFDLGSGCVVQGFGLSGGQG